MVANRLSSPLFSSRPKLSVEVTRWLRDAIMSGDYARGERLRVEELASKLEVSTMPVREALTTLVSEGLLESLPRRGYRVAPVSRYDIEDVFEVHAFVAGTLAERSALIIDASTIEQLRQMQRSIDQISRQRLATAPRAAQVEEVNFLFHQTINRVSSESSRLRWFLRAATRYVPRHFYQSIPGWIEATIADHPPIIDSLAERNGGTARMLMERHIRRAGELVVKHLLSTGQLSG